MNRKIGSIDMKTYTADKMGHFGPVDLLPASVGWTSVSILQNVLQNKHQARLSR